MAKFDKTHFQLLRSYLESNFDRYIQQWFPNAKRLSNGDYRTADWNDNKTKSIDGSSLSIDHRNKMAKDFATGETAGDMISIYSRRFNTKTMTDALKEIIRDNNLYHLSADFETLRSDYYKDKKKQEINDYYNSIENTTAEDIDYELNMSEDDESNIADAVVGLESEVIDPLTQNNNNKTKEEKQPKANSKEDVENNKQVKEILDKIKPYKAGDPVDLYLKNRGIKQYSYDCYIYEEKGINYLVNVCYRTKYDKDNSR